MTRRTKEQIVADQLADLEALIGKAREALARRRDDMSPKDLPVHELERAHGALGDALERILAAPTRAELREVRRLQFDDLEKDN
jgi:hypothetical protein